MNDLVKFLTQGNRDVTDYNSEQVERDIFWREKRKWVDSKLPTGYFEQPLLNKYRSFGQVETQFVSDPYYIEIDNRRWGELTDHRGRSLNPDTFRPIVSDAELKRMASGNVTSSHPRSNQETRFPILHGSDGYSNDINLMARIRTIREGHEKVVEDEKRLRMADKSLARFRQRTGIFNPGESLLERTGLGTSGTDISATRSQFNRNQGPVSALSENLLYNEDTPSDIPSRLRLHRRSSMERAIETPLLPSPLQITREAIVPEIGSSSTDYQLNEPRSPLEERRSPVSPTPEPDYVFDALWSPARKKHKGDSRYVYDPYTGRDIKRGGIAYENKRPFFNDRGRLPRSGDNLGAYQ